MKVVVIPEDIPNDQYVLKPIFGRLLRNIGAPGPKVLVPQIRLGGSGEALKISRLESIVEQYRYTADAFILCVDRDGKIGRRARLDAIEKEFHPNFFAVNAWEEIETWLLAGLVLPNSWRWSQIRSARDVKERYLERLASERLLSESLGGGRKILALEAASRVEVIRQKCPEDFDDLASRLESFVRDRH